MICSLNTAFESTLIKDEQGSPIKLATGEQGSATQFQNLMEICATSVSKQFASYCEKFRRNQI
jgi:hypothetical protein